jgi:hypothetical protein
MMKKVFLVLVLPIVCLFVGTALVDHAAAGPASGYELGKTKGFEDGVDGLSRTPTRHESSYSEADRVDFFRGYEDGYNEGIKAGAKLPGKPGASGYELGMTKGYQDGQAGLSRTPSRHEALYSEADRADFFRGYEAGYRKGIRPGAPAPASDGQPLEAVNGKGTVIIVEGSRKVTVCHTASPHIEQTRFINEQQQIVVKSRGNHGPATVQLFDTRSGAEQGRVMAYDIRGSSPPWAAGMGE